MRTGMLLLASAYAGTLACAPIEPADDVDSPPGGKADDADEFRLDGFDETLLVAGLGNELAILTVGDSFENQRVSSDVEDSQLTAIRSFAGRFYALYRNGDLLVIDGADARVLAHHRFPLESAYDFEITAVDSAYISAASDVVHIDPSRGSMTRAIALSGDSEPAEPRRMLLQGTALFVQLDRGEGQRGAVAVLDTETHTIIETIELEVRDAVGNVHAGLSPDLPMVYAPNLHQIFVTATGKRPIETGFLARINVGSLDLADDWLPAESGFQGAVMLDGKGEQVYITYHTSTPVASSHVFHYRAATDGTLSQVSERTLIDTFDSSDDLTRNRDGTLIAKANNCLVGFCIGGEGVNFLDAGTGEVLPKLFAEQIGFSPTRTCFLD